jgi:RNA polymerase sigma factor (sigma-70 family)
LDQDTNVGRAAGIESLYREQRDRLWRAVWAFSGDPDLAADAVAEAFAQVLRRGDQVRDPLAWVWRTAFRIAAGDLKARQNVAPFLEEVYEVPEPAVDLVRALRRLSPKQRAAIVLSYYAGYSPREIAAMIDSTSGAVRVHLTLGRRRLRDLLSEGGNDAR